MSKAYPSTITQEIQQFLNILIESYCRVLKESLFYQPRAVSSEQKKTPPVAFCKVAQMSKENQFAQISTENITTIIQSPYIRQQSSTSTKKEFPALLSPLHVDIESGGEYANFPTFRSAW